LVKNPVAGAYAAAVSNLPSGVSVQGSTCPQVYVDYCLDNGIIEANDFTG